MKSIFSFLVRYWYLLLPLPLIALYLIFFKGKINLSTMSKIKTSPTNMDKNQNLGMRNNNPLNIKLSAETWQGKIKSTNGFEAFSTIEYGYRAAIKTMHTYYTRDKIRTISALVSKWAPPIENKTSSYIAFVEEDSGLEKAVFSFNFDNVARIVSAMSFMESGIRPTDIQLSEAWALAGF
jgi:hypothetical protein